MIRSVVQRLRARSKPAAAPVVFNVVWTGRAFDHLKYFVASQIDHSDARFRFIANGCAPGQTAAMEQFASVFPGRIEEVFIASEDKMMRHGDVLDAVLSTRNDGEHFGLIDPDILARGPFVADFTERLSNECAAVTSGRGVWSDTDRIPDGHPGVNGEYFFSADGFVFGSPHFAIYRRDAIVETAARWGVGFGSGGPDLAAPAAARLADEGHRYIVYDTGKLMNAFLQFDGRRVEHMEHDQIMHVGGMSHYLAPPAYVENADGEQEPDWSQFAGMSSRFEVARFTARVLDELVQGRPAPPIPDGVDEQLVDRLAHVRSELIAMVERYDAPVRGSSR